MSGASGADAPACRLFLAVDCGEASREAFAREQSRLRRALDDPRTLTWTRPEQIHLTLIFLGSVPGALVPSLAAACAAPVPQRPFTLVFGGLGVFPSRGAPRVLWVGACEGGESAARLHDSLRPRVEALGIPVERRPFRPHLTLGRWRASRPSDAARIRRIPGGGAALVRVRVAEVVLYESRLSSSGSTYVPLARAPLGSGA